MYKDTDDRKSEDRVSFLYHVDPKNQTQISLAKENILFYQLIYLFRVGECYNMLAEIIGWLGGVISLLHVDPGIKLSSLGAHGIAEVPSYVLSQQEL